MEIPSLQILKYFSSFIWKTYLAFLKIGKVGLEAKNILFAALLKNLAIWKYMDPSKAETWFMHCTMLQCGLFDFCLLYWSSVLWYLQCIMIKQFALLTSCVDSDYAWPLRAQDFYCSNRSFLCCTVCFFSNWIKFHK